MAISSTGRCAPRVYEEARSMEMVVVSICFSFVNNDACEFKHARVEPIVGGNVGLHSIDSTSAFKREARLLDE